MEFTQFLVRVFGTEDQFYQLLTLVLVLFGLGLEIYQMRKEPSERYWIISTILWMFHAAFFYTYIALDRFTTIPLYPPFGAYTTWSSILRLQIIGSVVILEFFRIRQAKLRRIKKDLTEKLAIAKELEINRCLEAENKDLLERIHILALKNQDLLKQIKDHLNAAESPGKDE
jgi:hypothetical protein